MDAVIFRCLEGAIRTKDFHSHGRTPVQSLDDAATEASSWFLVQQTVSSTFIVPPVWGSGGTGEVPVGTTLHFSGMLDSRGVPPSPQGSPFPSVSLHLYRHMGSEWAPVDASVSFMTALFGMPVYTGEFYGWPVLAFETVPFAVTPPRELGLSGEYQFLWTVMFAPTDAMFIASPPFSLTSPITTDDMEMLNAPPLPTDTWRVEVENFIEQQRRSRWMDVWMQ